ncbi:MAG: class I SAM-dependent rRNA methyltransferase [Ectothiorhodospiraceae bacterium]|jgi:23S rRNA (cytosine1962-C5)-methyltransferase
MDTTLSDLYLKRGEDRRLRAGHLWVFSNEVDVQRTPLQELEPGAGVLIRRHDGKPVGCGYANPHSLICARLVSRDPRHPLDESLLVHRLKVALSLRQRLYDANSYRLVHGEGDGLPGLVVDRFGDTLAVQINTAGMERVRDSVVTALERVIAPRHILLRADSSMRDLEGLDRYVAWVGDSGPDSLNIEENGCRFQAPATSGQKTGWYFDHSANRRRLQAYVHQCRVLDLFSYVGAWGVEAAAAGAESVLAVESSAQACEWIGRNADLNGVGERMDVAHGDVFDVLAALREDGERFDVVVADPPAFVKRKKDLRSGIRAYQRLNQMAMQVLSRDGILVSASCSAHLEERELERTMLRSARHLDRSMQIVEYGRQAPDHPVHPAIPETRYIKAVFARILPAASTP